MGEIHANVDRADRILRIVLAPMLLIPGALLLLFAMSMGMSSAAAARWSDLRAAATAGVIGATVVWIGWLVASDRRIPGWFIFAFVALPGALCLIMLMVERRWAETISLAFILVPAVVITWNIAREMTVGKPAKLEKFDDLA